MDDLNVEDLKQTAQELKLEAVMVEFGKLEIEPGDVLLVRVDSRVLGQEGARENITEAIQKVFPKGTPWLLHDEYAEFAVVKDPAGSAATDASDDPTDDDAPDEGGEGAAVPAEVEHV